MKVKLYKYRPLRMLSKLIAQELQSSSGFRTEIFEILPNVYVVNMTDQFSNGKRDVPQFLEFKVK